jgi:hypothetical protein
MNRTHLPVRRIASRDPVYSYCEGQMQRIGLAILMSILATCPALPAGSEPGPGSVCIAPISWKALAYSAPGLYCDADKVSLKLDEQIVPSPVKESFKIASLDPTVRHRVVVFCAGKPRQSFTFRFSEFKTNELCLFLNDLYKTAQIWEAKRCPWCKCK